MKYLLFVLIFFLTAHCFAQNSRNGYYLPTEGTIRALIVFAERTNDINYSNPLDISGIGTWYPNQMPPKPEKIVFDPEFTGEANMQSELTKYFYYASHGELILIGDYFDTLVRVNVTSGSGAIDVVNFLDSLPSLDIETAEGYSVNDSDFDNWSIVSISYPDTVAVVKSPTPDNHLDLLFIVWRVNGQISSERNKGIIALSDYPIQLKGMTRIDCISQVCSGNIAATMRHEFGHTLLGGNNFHSGDAGVGLGTFMANMGGYSLLSSEGRNNEFCNAWDRWRLGWIGSDNSYFISSRIPYGPEYNSDFAYGDPLPNNGIFRLRDFATTGDVIKIQLPYVHNTLNSSSREQFLWIENRQFPLDELEENNGASCYTKGIHLNLQVGNNDTSVFDSRTNYIYQLCAFGNYDFEYGSLISPYQSDISTTSDMENPFTGFHFLMRHPYNFVDPNGTSAYDEIWNEEYFNPRYVTYNGTQISQSNFCSATGPLYGSIFDAFTEGDVIKISSNPAPVPVLTYETTSRGLTWAAPDSTPTSEDNQYIYLNGLSIEVLNESTSGYIDVQINWDDFDVDRNVRWCGDIIMYEEVNLLSNKKITLDLGLSATRPVDPITYNGTKIFNDFTKFYCKSESEFNMASNSTVDLINNSAFIVDSASNLNISSGTLEVKNGSTLYLKNGCDLSITGSGKIIVYDGGNICIESGAGILLDDCDSRIELLPGYNANVNSSVITTSPSCLSNPLSIGVEGSGIIYGDVEYIQDDEITSNRTVNEDAILVGRAVDPSDSQGDVYLLSGKLTLNAAIEVRLDIGFDMNGGQLDINIDNSNCN